MSDEISELELELSVTKKPRERIELLYKLSELLHEADPPRALELASEGLRLARDLGEKKSIAVGLRFVGLATATTGDIEGALRPLERSIAEFEALEDEPNIAQVCYTLATAKMQLAHYPEAIALLKRSRDICARIGNDRLSVRVHNVSGVLFKQLGDYPAALEHFLASQRIAESCGQLSDAAMALNNVGTIYEQLGDQEGELDCYCRSLQLSIDADDRGHMIVCLMNIGEVHRARGELDKAETCFVRAYSEVDSVPYPRFECMLLIALAQVAMLRGDDEQATGRLDAAIRLAEERGDTFVLGIALDHLAQLRLGRGELGEARRHAERALELAHESGELPREMDAERLLSECLEAEGEMAGALEHYRRHSALKEEVMSAERQRSMQAIQMRAEIEQAEKEREIYRLKSEQLEMTIEHKTKELGTLALHLVEKNGVLESLRRELSEVMPLVSGEARTALRTALRDIDSNIASARDWEAFETQFELLHHDFIANLSQHHPDLTYTELKVCALLKVNLSSKEIANVLSTSLKTVETHRYRIRKKLGLPADVHLGKHLAGRRTTGQRDNGTTG